MLFFCPRGKHTRSKRHARKVDDQWVSRCQNCGTPMVRLAKHRWAQQK